MWLAEQVTEAVCTVSTTSASRRPPSDQKSGGVVARFLGDINTIDCSGTVLSVLTCQLARAREDACHGVMGRTLSSPLGARAVAPTETYAERDRRPRTMP